MIISPENSTAIRSFKLGYSRGLPPYKAPKLLTNKKTEEYFVTSLYAQFLLYNNVPVIGIEVCENDSDKGADTILKVLNSPNRKIQITRFTLTEYLKRRKVAEKQVDKLIGKILSLTKVPIPVNVNINLHNDNAIPLHKEKWQDLLANEIATILNNSQTELACSDKFINHAVTEEKLKTFTFLITLQRVPQDFHSNFYGRDNLFIDLDFDNVGFTKEDVDNECLNIYNKKNSGKATILIIWSYTFEILYNPQSIVEQLHEQFKETTFEEVWFFDFYNHLHLHLENKIRTAQIK